MKKDLEKLGTEGIESLLKATGGNPPRRPRRSLLDRLKDLNPFRRSVHEPVGRQYAEVSREPLGSLALAGLDCDLLPGATGPFGQCAENPIPVNGLIGTYKYLRKLLSPSGNIVYFHRLGSVARGADGFPVDVYEVVDREGLHWDILFIDSYHPRRSDQAPEGYQLKRYERKMGDLPLAYGVDICCPDFPNDLPEAIQERNGLRAFARRARERIASGGFDRPEEQRERIEALRTKGLSFLS